MGKYILKALLFCIVFLATCGLVGMKDGFISPGEPEKQVAAEKVALPPDPEIVFSNTEVLPGGCFTIYLKGLKERDEIQTSSALVEGQPGFYNYQSGKLAIVGLSCRTKEGEYKYKVQVMRDGNIAAEREEVIKVQPKEFEKQYLEVSSSQKSKSSSNNFNDDRVHTDRAKAVTAEKPLWEGTFIKPVEGRISTEFGMIRYVNKVESERHSGLDIAAKKGTPVKAANNGVVRLAMMLKVTGNTVIIDHGCNIYSAYAHLDKLLVKEGAEVKKGDVIGEVGSTGFSTGPHLHWTTTIGKLFINPETLMGKDPLEFIDAGGQTN
ncbi:MAG TPA: M23 family metallopeptidase [Candidatus Nitrosocosmicus sp.]|nr:M23 family metallopeptidase [Candidatus Nitrosocosmicus sp.]